MISKEISRPVDMPEKPLPVEKPGERPTPGVKIRWIGEPLVAPTIDPTKVTEPNPEVVPGTPQGVPEPEEPLIPELV